MKTTTLPENIERFLDAMSTYNVMDAGTVLLLNLYGDNDFIIRLLKATGTNGYLTNASSDSISELNLHADKIMDHLPKEQIFGFLTLGRIKLRAGVKDKAEWAAYCAIHDACEGGVLENFKERAISKPGKRLSRRLHSPAFIRRYVSRLREIEDLRLVAKRLETIERRIPAGVYVENADTMFDAQIEAINTKRQENEVNGWRKIYGDHFRSKANRRAIKRAAGLSVDLLGREKTSRFIAGKAVVLNGSEFDFMVQRRATLDASGHGALALTVMDKAGYRLASLCFYIHRTPIIDQFIALELMLRAGDDDEILSKGNIVTLTERGEKIQRFASSHSKAHDALLQPYFEVTRKIWLDAICVATYGRGKCLERLI